MDVKRPDVLLNELLTVPEKILMGPGPSNCSREVLASMNRPVLGHLHKECLKIMDDVKEGIKYVFQTTNAFTLAVSGSGHCGMEVIFSNLTEKGDKVLIACNGHWGKRATDVAQRYGVHAIQLKSLPGDNFSKEQFEFALKTYEPKLLFVVQGESSTGVHQPVENLGQLCHRYRCLLAVDAVASLGSVPLYADKWQIDALYTGSQKVLAAPAGITPMTFSERAISVVKGRRTKPTVYYFDVLLLGDYWGCCGNKTRTYHHTISSTLLYGLRTALARFAADGYEGTIRRHVNCAKRLYDGLEKLGFELYVRDPTKRVPTVTTVKVPRNFNWKAFIDYVMAKHNIEISGGLGPTAGQVIRIGLMGNNARMANVNKLLVAFEEVLNHLKFVDAMDEIRSKL